MVHLKFLTVFILIGLLPYASVAQEEPFRIKTLVIDAGHGGKDPGNLGTGRYKTREKDIALDVAKRLGDYILEQFPEINVLYTRDTDVFIGLNERADIANSNKADLFISIHCNSINYPSARGVETFVLGLHKNEENLQIAMKENSAIFLEDDYETKYEGFDPNSPESLIALSMMQSAFLDQSLSISSYIQRQFKERVGRRDRGVKQAGFLVLRKTTMPSILIELGFLTNPEEEDFLNSESGRVYMASAILRGFKEYKDLVEDPLPENQSVESAGTKDEKEVSVDLKQAELKAELERKKAELAKKKGIDEKALQDSLDKAAEVEGARIKAELEAKKKAEEAAKQAEEVAKKAEAERLAAEQAEQVKKAEEARKAEEAKQAAAETEAQKEAEEARRAALEKEKAEQARIAAQKAEQERLAKEQQQAQLSKEIAEKAEAMRIAEEKAEAERKAAEEREAASAANAAKLEAERIAAEQKAKEEKRLAAAKAAEEQEAAKQAEEAANQKAREDALNRIEMERLKREVLAGQREAAQQKKEQEAKATKAEAEKAEKAKKVESQSAQLDDEAKRLEELKAKKAEIEARLAKLDEPKPAVKPAPTEAKNDGSGVLFKVQIHTATKVLDTSSSLFRGLTPDQYEQDGLYKYTVGAFTNIEDAGPTQTEMRDRGFKGAFIVAFKDGNRIKVSEARKLTENNGN